MIDAWSDPSKPPTPQQFKHNEPNGIRLLLDKIKAIELQVREVRSNLLGPAGIRVSPAGMTIDSDLAIIGTLTATEVVQTAALAPGSVTASKLGVGSVTAPALGAGSVGYAALASPLIPAVANITTTTFATTTTWAEVCGVDLVVPSDCTRLLVNATGHVYALNNSAANDVLNVRVSLDAVNGQAFLTPLLISGFGTISAALATLADTLTPGSTLRLSVGAKTNIGTFTADASDTAACTATLIWLR